MWDRTSSSETWLQARGEACGLGDVINTMQIRSRRPWFWGRGGGDPVGMNSMGAGWRPWFQNDHLHVSIYSFFPTLLRLSPEMYFMIHKMQPWGLFLTFHDRQFMGFWGFFFFFSFGLFNMVYFIQEEFYTLRANLSVWWCPWLTVFWWPLVASLSLWSHKNTGGWERAMQGKGRRERFSSRKNSDFLSSLDSNA